MYEAESIRCIAPFHSKELFYIEVSTKKVYCTWAVMHFKVVCFFSSAFFSSSYLRLNFFIIVFTYVSFHVFTNYFSCLVSQQQQPQLFVYWAAIKIYIIQSAFCSSYFVFLQFICNLIKSSTMLLLVYRVLTRAAWSSFLEASSNEHRERRSC